jgi:penicillin-binding protein 2
MDFDQIFDKIPSKLSIKKLSAKRLEPEEVFLDARKDYSHKIESPIKKENFSIMLSLIILIFLALVFKAGWLQIVKGDCYKAQAEKNSVRILPIFSPRGIIYDFKGEQLVYNEPIFDLAVIPSFLPEDKNERLDVIKKVADIAGLKPEEIESIIEKNRIKSLDSVVVEENLDRDKALVLETEIKNLPGFSLEKNLQRNYTDGQYFSDIIGYVGRMGDSEAGKHPDYFPAETIGKDGLEAQYESILRTPPGKKQMKVDATGRIVEMDEPVESSNAKGLVLSIDAELQKHIFDSLKSALKKAGASQGAAVAMDPRDGHVLALVSLPGFDNNLFSKGISQEDYDKLIQNPDQPFFNRAITGQYAPGSTAKLFLGAAGLQEKVINPATTIVDKGALIIPNQYNPNITYIFPDWKTHGAMNITSAIAQSCDIFFYYLGGGYDDFKGLGLDRIEKYLKLFGFGKETGIDLPNEKSGFVPSSDWKKEAKGEDWLLGDTYHLSIGQGDLTATPLQIADFTAAIANGGTIWEPKVVDKIIDSEKNTITSDSQAISSDVARIISGIKPAGRKLDFISKENLDIIKNAMRETIQSGSAQSLKDLPFEVAGKTGTAQVAGKANNSWFTSFAPYDDPQIVLTILAEGGGEGSSTAVPVAKDVLNWYFQK